MKLDASDLERKQIIEKYIEDRTSLDKDKSQEELNEVSVIIKQLNSFIDGNLELSANGIEIKIQRLISHFTLNLIYELDSDIAFRRARKFEEKNSKTSHCFDELQELSYIPENKKKIIPLGRFNKKEESIFYASIHYKEDDEEQLFHTALSEVNANKLDYINLLDSIPTKRLNVVYIGVFDYFMRNTKIPKWIDEYYYMAFKLFKKKCIEKDNIYIFESYILSNAFFADITQRDGSDRLYRVTSIISSILLLNENTEALVYESVKIKNSPVIAIKTNIVDSYIEHKESYCYYIKENLGYGIYGAIKINECQIIDNKTTWKDF